MACIFPSTCLLEESRGSFKTSLSPVFRLLRQCSWEGLQLFALHLVHVRWKPLQRVFFWEYVFLLAITEHPRKGLCPVL